MSRTYAADDLLATSTYSTGESYAFSYTPAHRLSGVTGTGGALSFTYNPVGWLLSATDTAGGTTFATTYAYDEAGRVTSLDSAAAPPVTYAYDLAGRLASIEASGAVATFTHDAAGARTGMSLPNGALTSYAYDPAGRIESIVTTAASGVIAESYTRDAAGRVVSDSFGAYAYDDAGRLISWTAPTGAVTTYAYDAASNFTGASVDGSATVSFAVDAADRITSPGFTYDDAGNLTCDGERTFTYDAAGRLTAVADAATGVTIATYAYDAFNRRVSATEGGATVFFHYDGASARVIAETDATGATIATYAYDSAGTLFSMRRGGATYYYHLNARGDVVALSDSTGAVVNTYAYDPWGTLFSASETVANPYRYASYRYDEATGLSYCWNRYYAPELGRFLTRDIYPGELSDPVTMNPYLYCGGDPVNRVDPSGKVFASLGYDLHDFWQGLWGSKDETAYGRFNWQARPSRPDAIDTGTQIVACAPGLGVPGNIGLGLKHAAEWSQGKATACDVALDVVGIVFDPTDWARALGGAAAANDFLWLTAGEGFKQDYPLIYADPNKKAEMSP